MLSGVSHFFKRLITDTKPKPIDLKDYPLFQLQQAFEAKEFDAKRALTALRDDKFTLDCPTIENIHLLPFWVNVMCNHKDKLYQLIMLLLNGKQPKQLAMQPEIAAAKDPVAFVEACQEYLLFTSEFNKPGNKIVKRYMEHMYQYFFIYCKMNNYHAIRGRDSIIKLIKQIGKNDLTHRIGHYSVTLVELLASLKIGDGIQIADDIQLILDAIESQPAIVPMQMNAITQDWRSSIIQEDYISCGGFRLGLLATALNTCCSYFTTSSQTFSVEINALKATLAQLINENWHQLYVIVHKVARNNDALKTFLEAMKTAKIDEANINHYRVSVINLLFDQFKIEADQEEKAILEARIIEQIHQAKAECFLLPGYPHRTSSPVFTSLLQPFCYSNALLTAMLTALNNSNADLTNITIPLAEGNRSLLEHLCKEHEDITNAQLQEHIKLLIHAGIDPTADLTAGKIPEQYAAFIKATFDQYRNGIMTELTNLIRRDTAGVALSYFFQPATADSSSSSPSVSPRP